MSRSWKQTGKVHVAILVLIALGTTLLFGQRIRTIPAAPPYKPNCAEGNHGCQAWALFRTGHPYPYQAIQWQELPAQRLAILLLEPPPVIGKMELEKLIRTAFGSDLLGFERFRWKLGIDGWLEDTVLTVSAPGTSGTDPLQDPLFRDRIAFLHLALFGTAYGATFDLQKDRNFARPSEAAQNIRVNPGEVRRWLSDATLKWQTLGDGPVAETSWSTVTSQHKFGAFIAADRSLVLLTFPIELLKDVSSTGKELNRLAVPFRCFAVATDAIVGGFEAANGHLAILGRPRTQSVASVPPLRFETFKLLATQTADELSQSYERRALYAGKMMRGDYLFRDWAPIYLSDALVDTEFGALLNITDQLLKSWSEAGHVDYLHFNYPKPKTYPFKTALSEKVEADSGSTSVLFNWNTAGSAVMVNTATGKAFASRQTGALPVTYGAGEDSAETDKLKIDEETAYQYFASQRDANLARVVQYTLLYQFFRAVNPKPANIDSKGVARGLEPAVHARRQAAAMRTRATVKMIADVQSGRVSLAPEDKKLFTLRLTRFLAQNPDLASDEQVASVIADRFSDESRKLQEARRGKLLAAGAELDSKIDDYNSRVFEYNLRPAGPAKLVLKASLDASRAEIQTMRGALQTMEKDNPIADIRRILTALAEKRPEMEDVRRGFVESYAYEPSGSIKTPSIVISWDPTDITSVGGHNLDARTLKMEVSSSVTGIKLEKTESGLRLMYSPSKASLVEGHATELARAVEHGHVRSTADLEKIIAPSVPTRSRTVALNLPSAAGRGEGAGSLPDAWSARLGGRVYTNGEKAEFVRGLRGMSETSACCEFIGYDDGGTAFATQRSPHPPPATVVFELRDSPSMAEHVSQAARTGRPVIFLDTPADHVEALALQANIDAPREAGLGRMAESLGSRRSGARQATYDGIAERDANGEVGFLQSVADKTGSEARNLLRRLTFKETPAAWAEARVSRLEATELAVLVDNIGWNSQTDGTLSAVKLSFGATKVNGAVDVSVAAGFADADLIAGRNTLYGIHGKTLKAARAKGQSLAQYAITIKNELARMPAVRAKRITVVVQRGKTRQLFSMRDHCQGNELIENATKHARSSVDSDRRTADAV